jgi:hypothetical protein
MCVLFDTLVVRLAAIPCWGHKFEIEKKRPLARSLDRCWDRWIIKRRPRSMKKLLLVDTTN